MNRFRLPNYVFWVAVALMFLIGGRLFVSRGLLGSPSAETYGHAWRQWWTGAALPNWATGPGSHLMVSKELPLIDPLPTLLAASVGRLFTVEAGYNSWILLSVFLAFIGGAVLAKRLGGDPTTGGVVLALSPPFLGSLSSGLTEDGAVGLVALSMALIGDRDWRKGATGGLLLGLTAFCGLVLAWGAGVMAVIWGLGIMVRDPSRWKSLLAGALSAMTLAGAAAALQGDRLGSGAGHRSGTHPLGPEPLWPLNPWQGVDLASFFRPGRFDAGEAIIRTHPGWLGAAALGLSLWATLQHRSRLLPLWLVLVICIVWAPGDHLYWAGEPLHQTNPMTTVMDAIPFGSFINHHGRLLIIGSVALAGLAAVGAARMGPKAPWMAAIIALEIGLLSPISPMLPVAPSTAPDVLHEIDELQSGPLLVVPITGPGVHHQRPFLDQRVHGRTLVSDPDNPGLSIGLDPEWKQSPTARWLSSLAHCAQDRAEPHHRCEAPSSFESPQGIALIFAPSDYRTILESVLGPPSLSGDDGSVWELIR